MFVNNFFAWVSAEALREGRGIIDKYIGDAIMVVFSKEFGSTDPFSEALDAARWMGEHDVLDYCPHIGLASGLVTVGYVGTPLRYGCSVFGRPVDLASRCADIPRESDAGLYSSSIAFPAAEWSGRQFELQFYPQQVRRPDGSVQDRPISWEPRSPRAIPLKGIGPTEVIQIINRGIRIPAQLAEHRAQDGLQAIKESGRYWPRPRTSASSAQGASRINPNRAWLLAFRPRVEHDIDQENESCRT